MEKKKIQIFPSILSGDFGKLAEEATKLEESGADGIHIDIMDGHFVPNLTLGPRAVSAINRASHLFLDVHLMIYNPFDYIEAFIQAGADRITFHFEATEDVEDTLEFIRKCGKQAGLAFRPETSPSMTLKFLNQCDLILLMTVNPGFGGQVFMPEVVKKIKLVTEAFDRLQLGSSAPPIQVDGGIIPETAHQCIAAGASILVSGNYLYHQPSMAQGIKSLRKFI